MLCGCTAGVCSVGCAGARCRLVVRSVPVRSVPRAASTGCRCGFARSSRCWSVVLWVCRGVNRSAGSVTWRLGAGAKNDVLFLRAALCMQRPFVARVRCAPGVSRPPAFSGWCDRGVVGARHPCLYECDVRGLDTLNGSCLHGGHLSWGKLVQQR